MNGVVLTFAADRGLTLWSKEMIKANIASRVTILGIRSFRLLCSEGLSHFAVKDYSLSPKKPMCQQRFLSNERFV